MPTNNLPSGRDTGFGVSRDWHKVNGSSVAPPTCCLQCVPSSALACAKPAAEQPLVSQKERLLAYKTSKASAMSSGELAGQNF